MSNIRRPKPLDITYPARKTLWFLGLYTGRELPKHILHDLNYTVVIAILTLFPNLVLIELLQHDHSLSDILEILHYLLVHIWMVIKLMLYLSQRSRLRILEDQLESVDLNVQNKRQDHFISSAIGNQKFFAGFLLVMGWIFTLMFATLPLVSEQSLLVPIWTPMELNEKICHAYETIYYCVMVCIYTSVDSMVIGYTASVTAQLEILRDNLISIAERDEGLNQTVQELVIRKRLKNCVIHHISILKFAGNVEGMFSFIVFYQVLFSILGICLTGIQFLLVPLGSVKFVSECVYLTGMLVQIFSPCWFAQDITLQSLGVIESCFMSDWHTCSPSTRKILFLIMERAKRPIVLMAGPFIALSLDTFVMILRNGYSFFAVLSSLYS